MLITLNAFTGALFMGGMGLFTFGLLQKWIFPQLFKSYENAKATASQGINPAVYVETSRIILLIGMPVLGYFLGDLLLTPIFG